MQVGMPRSRILRRSSSAMNAPVGLFGVTIRISLVLSEMALRYPSRLRAEGPRQRCTTISEDLRGLTEKNECVPHVQCNPCIPGGRLILSACQRDQNWTTSDRPRVCLSTSGTSCIASAASPVFPARKRRSYSLRKDRPTVRPMAWQINAPASGQNVPHRRAKEEAPYPQPHDDGWSVSMGQAPQGRRVEVVEVVVVAMGDEHDVDGGGPRARLQAREPSRRRATTSAPRARTRSDLPRC